MGKIHPNDHRLDEEPNSSGEMSNKRETYTVWMKSLVFHSNGCTVYNSDGDIVYRVDNYDTKGTREVDLMDLQGTVLCTIHKRKLGFGCWEGFRSNSRSMKEERWFQVKRYHKMMIKGKGECEMRVGKQKYWIVGMGGKSAEFRIMNMEGQIVAEVKQKESWSGVVLGDDVVTMQVEANTDHSLIMAFVMVYGLIRRRM
ncbi:protein LURP-one-related 4-like [Prosopis cineraria]|uniref:protein LURP-one-related 4-like n=1 Tax=Prosopis cineraria TaxID=364024 RepID=UPI00240EE6A1|nr:protein LURP-one-related 4-like [Prosopis cineraria]XP_054822950.1 protein LURP-one-related 4-like [Prosopis cineraria]